MMPELSSESSFESEPQKMYNHLEGKSETIMTSIQAPYHYKNLDEIHNCDNDEIQALRNISFDESVLDRPSSDNNGSITIIDDIISEFKDSDIALMQEALSTLIDDDEVKVLNDDQCDCHDNFIATKNHLNREYSDRLPFDIRSCKQNHYVDEQKNHLLTPDDSKNNACVQSEIVIDHYPGILPQVTFEDEEEFVGKNFFEQHELPYRSSKSGVNDPIVSSETRNDPSQWLLEQLAFDTLSVDYSLGHESISLAPKKGNDVRNNKGDICASKETKHKHWTDDEDEILRLAMETERMTSTNWVKLARNYFNNVRSATQCKNRWKNVSTSYIIPSSLK